MNADAAPRLAPGVRLRHETDGAFLLVPEGVVELSESAVAVLELVDGSRDVDAIAAELARRFEAPAEELRADVAELCGALQLRGYLRT